MNPQVFRQPLKGLATVAGNVVEIGVRIKISVFSIVTN